MTTPSAGLAEHCRRTVETEVRVLENYVTPTAPRSAPSRPELVLGWVANVEHRDDVERLGLRNDAAAARPPPHVHLVTIGCGLGLSSERYHHIRGVHFEELRGYVAPFDVGLAPIADSAFNRSRST